MRVITVTPTTELSQGDIRENGGVLLNLLELPGPGESEVVATLVKPNSMNSGEPEDGLQRRDLPGKRRRGVLERKPVSTPVQLEYMLYREGKEPVTKKF